MTNENIKGVNQKGVVEKIKNLINHNYDYVWMKLFSRIYFFKRLFLLFNRLGQVSSITNINMPTDKAVKLRKGASIDGIVVDLHKQGCSEKIMLNKETLSNIVDFAMNARSYAYGDPKHGFYLSEKEDCENKLQKDILLAKYFNFQEEKVFNNLINSSILESIATKYLGKGTKNIATQLWWTFPADVDASTRSKAAHFFHRDVDAWGFVKFFFYVINVCIHCFLRYLMAICYLFG